MFELDANLANQRMVDRLIADGALWSPPLINAFRQTPRHRFLDHVFVLHPRHEGWREVDTTEPNAEEIDLLYSDRALITRLGRGEAGPPVAISSSSQPSLMAEMLEDLQPKPGQRVLEIGAGTGYNAALIAHVVGPELVHALDVDPVVLEEATEHFRGFANRGVQLHQGDGRQGLPEMAPYDRIIVTASTPDLERAWLTQMADRGVIVAPLTLAPGLAFVVRGMVRNATFVGALTRGAYFMPLRSATEAPGDDKEFPDAKGPLHNRPAPWAGWFDRQLPRLPWSRFVQALVFYGWLRGLKVLHSGSTTAYASYGVGRETTVCWFNADDWQVCSASGEELGKELWQAWLNAGGPWPTEFQLTASANVGGAIAGPECFLRQGPRCRQVWQLDERRQRQGWR